jgi:apolipoprotein N-acyltransferase
MAAAIAVVGALVASFATRRLASPFLAAAAWVVLEALRGRWPLGGFPWADLGITLHDVPAARALASFGGTLLVTFVVVAVNGCVLELGLAVANRKTRAGALSGAGLAAAGLAGLLLVTVVADIARYEPRTTGHLRVALLQGDDEQLPLADQTNQLLTAKHLALAGQLGGHYDLIVFPESALDTDPETDPGLREQLTTIAAEHGASVLVNARTLGTNNQYRNTNRLYTPTGRLQGSYSKQHLVPFGEYVPWRDQLSFLRELRQIPYDFQAGNSRTIFHIAGHPLGSVICFESAFAPLVRDYVRDGAQVIVVSTNNRSYQRSANSEQHLASSQMRAAETGRPVLQASVSGISAVIEPDGTVHDATKLFQAAIVTATVPTTTGETPYVRFGDWVVLDCALALLVVTVIAVRRPVTSPGA